MCQESWKNFITILLSRPRSGALFILFKKEAVDTGSPETGRQADGEALQGAPWGVAVSVLGNQAAWVQNPTDSVTLSKLM